MKQRLLWLVGQDHMPPGLWPIEWLAFTYSSTTVLLMLVFWPGMDHPWEMLAERIYILCGTVFMWGIYKLWPRRLTTFARITLQMALLSYWYPDTYEFNRTLPNMDHFFAHCDAVIFKCQPSLEFSRLCPWPWFSEALNMGYFSYYILIAAVMIFFFLCRNSRYEKAAFVVMCSFFIHYLIYISLPVAGPQYYFQAVSTEAIRNGIFPRLGYYCCFHRDMQPAPGYADALFYKLVCHAQDLGERPTAAFPSSHIGITLILLYLVYPQSRRFFLVLLPFALLLMMATVYIQAHYLVDALAGVLTSYPVFRISSWIYSRIISAKSALTEYDDAPEEAGTSITE
ncbi:MAG: phosphatase PAP2 family protein [Paraprevotella sp.]|nr:phosphatase PAP2 family protein [Paraprevotella sp.]